MYLQYSRYLRRNVALLAIYILLTTAVVGLLLILCVSNSRADLPFMVRPELDKPASIVAVHRSSNSYDIRDDAVELGTLSNVVDPTRMEALPGIGIEMNTEAEQQHIYIDDVSNTILKLQKVPITERPIDLDADRDSAAGQGSGTLTGNVFNFKEFDDENDDDDEAMTSGSGNNKATTYDLETKDFIKRISIKLSQLSKAKPKKEGQRKFKLGKNSLINRERVPISDYRHRSVTEEKGNPPKAFIAPPKNFEISRNFLRPTAARPPAFATFKRQVQPIETQIRTRRIISNEKKSDERSRQLLLCFEMGNSSGRELCRMLFKETES